MTVNPSNCRNVTEESILIGDSVLMNSLLSDRSYNCKTEIFSRYKYYLPNCYVYILDEYKVHKKITEKLALCKMIEKYRCEALNLPSSELVLPDY